MIEAVNSTIASAATSRALTEAVDAVSVAPVNAVLPPSPQGAPDVPQAPYVSPYISVDLNYNKAVLQIRDSETGDVQQQFPTESRLAQIRRSSESIERAQLRDVVPDQPAESTPGSGGTDVITLQQVTSSQPSNAAPSSTPQAAIAALSTGAQSGQASQSAGVSVLA